MMAIKDTSLISADVRHSLSATWNRLEALYDLGENWNGIDVSAPNPEAIEIAKAWIQELYLETQNENLRWISPHVSADEEGQVAFEWAKGKKRLTVYASPEEITYIKAWGPSILCEMEDGQTASTADRISLWSWLTE